MFRVTIRSSTGEDIDETTRSSDTLTEALFQAMDASCDLGCWSPYELFAHAVANGAEYSTPAPAFESGKTQEAIDAFVQAARNVCDAIGWKYQEI